MNERKLTIHEQSYTLVYVKTPKGEKLEVFLLPDGRIEVVIPDDSITVRSSQWNTIVTFNDYEEYDG